MGFPSRNVIQLFGEKAGRSSMEKFLETWLPRNTDVRQAYEEFKEDFGGEEVIVIGLKNAGCQVERGSF